MQHVVLCAGQKNIEQLLIEGGIRNVNQNVLRRALAFFSSRMALALSNQKPEWAADAYLQTELLPSTDTKKNLSQTGILVNGELLSGHESLLICFKKTVPHILKCISQQEQERLTAILKNFTHPNVVAFEMVSNKYMVMPWHPTTLEHMKYLVADEALQLWQNMESALNGLHAHQLAHMDVKPSNILISSVGTFVLGDLGSLVTFGQKSVSTKAYIPRDMQRESPLVASATVDWWMLAMTFAEKVTGLDVGAGCMETSRHELKETLSNHQNMQQIWPVLSGLLHKDWDV